MAASAIPAAWETKWGALNLRSVWTTWKDPASERKNIYKHERWSLRHDYNYF